MGSHGSVEWFSCALSAALLAACGTTTNVGVAESHPGGAAGPPRWDAAVPETGARVDAGTATGGVGGASVRDAGAPDAGDAGNCRVVLCLDQPNACGDCVDNDGDGLVDLDDEGCITACDNSEDFVAVTPGPTGEVDRCYRDCLFDSNTGSGDDQCRYNVGCWGVPECAARADSCGTASATACIEQCLPRTPNGCDCYGCCELAPGTFVYLRGNETTRAGCAAAADVNDPARCVPCTPVADCYNPCEACEECVSRREVPTSCGAASRCPGGTPCGASGMPPCPGSMFCLTGCCVSP